MRRRVENLMGLLISAIVAFSCGLVGAFIPKENRRKGFLILGLIIFAYLLGVIRGHFFPLVFG